MVTRGQLLERPVVIPTARGDCLDGIYLRGGPLPLLVASPLPGAGGTMQHAVLNELAYAAALSERASLRMDYRGVGASEGTISLELAHAVEDLREGVSYLCDTVRTEKVAVAGWDTGAWAALALAQADPRVERVALISPSELPPPAGVPGHAELARPILLVVPVPEVERDLRAQRDRLRGGVLTVRVELIESPDRTLRQGLGALQKIIPPFLGAQRRE